MNQQYLGPIQKYFRFRGDIYEIRFFSLRFPGNNTIVTRKSVDFQVTIPGNREKKNISYFLKGFIVYFVLTFWPISGNCYPEINRFPGDDTRKSVNFQELLPGG